MALVYALAAAGTELRVLPSAFATHVRHPPSAAKAQWADDASDRACKRLLWVALLRDRPLPL
jgi:hypothetical protein